MNEPDIAQIAGETMEFIMAKLPKEEGPEFTNYMLEILTLCTSTMIGCGYCSCHYKDGLNKVIKLIKDDLKNKEYHEKDHQH
jgi:hypothetical protein